MKFIDAFINTITMYRLVLYYLIVLLIVAGVYCLFGILPYNPLALAGSTALLLAVCWVTNTLFAKAFHAPANTESVYITALILALIISPPRASADIPVLVWAGILSMASKYMLAINKKHIFNPAAIAVVLTAIGFNGSASWWIGTTAMLPFLLLGILIVRKIQRYDLIFYFFLSAVVTILGCTVVSGGNVIHTLQDTFLVSPIFFFAFVMLTEPLTTPPTKGVQAIYGALVGFLYAPQIHIGSFYTTPELALVIGNIFSYMVSPKYKLVLSLKEKIQHSTDIIDFSFPLQRKLAFEPGQYMEFTLPHAQVDRRGNRRYFTIASSPTEETLKLGVKFYSNGSSFKKNLLKLSATTPLIAAQLAGDFTLPKDPNQKLVFIAGGIGVTPFRSMLKYLLDTRKRRTITVFYAVRNYNDFIYVDILNQAWYQLGIRTIYVISDPNNAPPDWRGKVGYIDAAMIRQEVPDYTDRLFYLSGTHAMTDQFKTTLQQMGLHRRQIKTDFFPGFA